MNRTMVAIPFESFLSSTKPTMAQTVDDLRSELRRTQARLEGIEKDLNEEKRQHAMTKAKLASEKVANRRMHDMYIPDGDMKRGYFCGVCGCEVDYPFEQDYCSYCGTRIDWRTRNDQLDGDDNAYDLAGDR